LDNKSTTQREIAYLKIINDFTVNLLRQDSISGIAWSITKDAIAHLGFVDCVVYIVEKGVLVQKAAHGPKNPIHFDIKNPITISFGKGIVGTVAENGKAVLVKDTSLDERYIVDDEFRFSELCVPIILEGKVIGVIDSEHPRKVFFTENHLSIMQTIASMAAIKIGQAKANKALKITNEYLEELVNERTCDLEKALKNVNLANEKLQFFSYNVSHDLRQPLRMISSYAQLLKRRFSDKLGEEGLEYIDFAYEGAMSAQKLVNDLLQFARIGVNEEDFEMVDLNKMILIVLNNLQTEIRATNPQILYTELPKINGVKTLITQLFQNLIHNALKFRRENRPVIDISVKDEGTYYTFQVEDNGVGMTSTDKELIFDAFVKSKSQENFEGTGLGLAICKRIVEKHNGKIWVTSELNAGSIFHFTIGKRGSREF
jgi:signal transduction histidine kinase